MRTFAYVVLQRWETVLTSSALTTVLAITAIGVRNPLPLAIGLAVQALVVPWIILGPVRRARRPAAPGWASEVWGPDVGTYSATAAPFTSQRGASTMLRSTATISAWGAPRARYERFDVPTGALFLGPGTHVELLHLDHWMPTVIFGRVPAGEAGADGLGPSAIGPELGSQAPGVGYLGDALLVGSWMTDRAKAALVELLSLVPWVTLSGASLYAYGHRAGDPDARVLYLVTQLALELRPALRSEYGEPVDADDRAWAVTGRRGSATLTWASLLSATILPVAGTVFGLAAVSTPAEQRPRAKLLARGAVALNVALVAAVVPLWFAVVPVEGADKLDEESGDSDVPEFPWDRREGNEIPVPTISIPSFELPEP